MSSWRDEPDPDCPECGGPISPTSQYCMHCGTDFDDQERSESFVRTDETARKRQGSTEGGTVARLLERVGEWRRSERDSRRDDSTRKGDRRRDRDTGHSAERRERREDSSTRGTTAVPKAPLWMRGLTAFIVSVPVSLAASFILVALTESVIESVSALMLPVIWGGTLVYLVQKPLPSDIIGDALYALAGLLVVGPLLGYGLMIVRAQFTSATLDKSVGFVLVELLSIEFMILWPATFLFVLGYAGNAWAARRLRNSAE